MFFEHGRVPFLLDIWLPLLPPSLGILLALVKVSIDLTTLYNTLYNILSLSSQRDWSSLSFSCIAISDLIGSLLWGHLSLPFTLRA